ncbi:MAG: LVIVD repeat-containing protein [Candidatus Helarchaeota archaeon]
MKKKIKRVLLNFLLINILINCSVVIFLDVNLNHYKTNNNVSNYLKTGSVYNNKAFVSKWPGKHSLGEFVDIYVENDTAFIAAKYGGLLIFNVSKPDAISVISNYETNNMIMSIEIKNKFAYLASSSEGLIILDISNLSNPINIAQFKTNSSSYRVKIFNDTAFLCEGSKGVILVNISNPWDPTYISEYDTVGTTYDIDVRNKVAYLADGPNGLVLLNISNQYNPTLINSISTNDSAYDIYISGNYSFIADYQKGFTIINISDPNSLHYINNFDTNGISYKLEIIDKLAFIADGTNGFVVLNITNVSALSYINSFKLNDSQGIKVVGNLAYISDSGFGLYVINVSNLQIMKLIGSYKIAGRLIDVKVSNGLGYLLNYYQGLQIVNLSSKEDIKLMSSFKFNNTGKSLEIINNIALIAVRTEGLYILDISSAVNPKFIKKVSLSSPQDIAIYNYYYVYIANGGSGYVLIDILIPEYAYIINTFKPPGIGFCYGVEVDNTNLFVADGENGLFIYDIKVPSNPIFKTKYDTKMNAIDTKIVGTILYLIDYPNSVQFLNISDISNVTLIYNFSEANFTNDIRCTDSYLYIADWNSGLFFLNTMNITAPIKLNETKITYANKLYVNSGFLYVADIKYLYLFIAPPEMPYLMPIAPNITITGEIHLKWKNTEGINKYKIYRSNLPTMTKSTATLIAITDNNNFTDRLTRNGIYYYMIVPNNMWGDGPSSNIQEVNFILNKNTENDLYFLLFTILMILIGTIIGSIALNFRYHFILKSRTPNSLKSGKSKNKSIIRKIEKALKGMERKDQFIANFKKLLEKDPNNITLNKITRSWTQHYVSHFMQVYGLPKEGAELRATRKKEEEIKELYNRLKNVIKIDVKIIKFGKYAGSKSYKIIINNNIKDD